MADALKVLGQIANPTSATALYTVPSGVMTTVSTLMVCNRTAGDLTFRVYIAVADESVADKQYIFYDTELKANHSVSVTVGITLNETDVVYAQGSATGLSFSLFGVETS